MNGNKFDRLKNHATYCRLSVNPERKSSNGA